MTEDTDPREALQQRIDAIEETYEFMLAYAAQGRKGDDRTASSGIQSFLQRADDALDDLSAIAKAVIDAGKLQPADVLHGFADLLAEDARRAQAAVRLVKTRPSISSQIVDNLNASIHVRTLLTDLFLIDEALTPGKDGQTG